MNAESRLDSDLALAHRLADAAAHVSLSHFQRELRSWSKPDGSLATEADLAVEDTLRVLLNRERPTDAVLGEERGPQGVVGRQATKLETRMRDLSGSVSAAGRLEFIDSLRGFALFGVFWANLLIFFSTHDGGRRFACSRRSARWHSPGSCSRRCWEYGCSTVLPVARL